jgi:hypothetical protein
VLYIEEIWKDIRDYEGMYQVSTFGRIRSLDRYVKGRYDNMQLIRGKILSICYNKRVEVCEIHLRKNNKRKCFKIHRLVAEAFLENDDPTNKTTVNHIDGNRKNNRVDNLEWATYSENEKHAYDKLHRPINRPKLMKRRCISIDKQTNVHTVYESIEAASRGTNVSCTQIRRIAKNESENKNFYFLIEGINN